MVINPRKIREFHRIWSFFLCWQSTKSCETGLDSNAGYLQVSAHRQWYYNRRKGISGRTDSNCISGFVCPLQSHQNLQWLKGDVGWQRKKKNTGSNFSGNIGTNFMTSTHLVLQRSWCQTPTEHVLLRGDKPSDHISRQATWKYSWRMPLGP